MAITQRGKLWEILHSWWILLTLSPLCSLSWAGFGYAFLRIWKFKYLLYTLLYLTPLIAMIYMAEVYPTQETREQQAAEDGFDISDFIIFYSIIMWIVSIVHAFIARKEFLIHLDARGRAAVVATEKMKTKVASNYGVESHKVDKMLVEFDEDDYTVRLVRALFSAVPFAPPFVYYFNLEGAVKRVNPLAGPDVAAKAAELALDPDVTQALKITSAMDSIDKGLGIFTGARNIYDHVKRKEGRRTFEADTQQAADAAIKALAMAYMIYKLFPGSIKEKVQAFAALPAGQEMLLFYSSAEIALPFTDNLLEAGSDVIVNLMNANRDNALERFRDYASNTPMDDVLDILESLQMQIAGIAGQVKVYIDPLTEKVNAALPGIMNATDSVTGAAATGIDLLPAWRFLGGRLAAEACVQRAIQSELG